MRLTICAVGRARNGPEHALFAHYRNRLGDILTLKEVEEKRKRPPAQRTAREGELLLDAAPGDALIVALDERGARCDSAAFARMFQAWCDRSGGRIAFLIGGANGLADAVRARADALLSLGDMTWPHMLVRALLAEQLYRARAILGGHPYHRE